MLGQILRIRSEISGRNPVLFASHAPRVLQRPSDRQHVFTNTITIVSEIHVGELALLELLFRLLTAFDAWIYKSDSI